MEENMVNAEFEMSKLRVRIPFYPWSNPRHDIFQESLEQQLSDCASCKKLREQNEQLKKERDAANEKLIEQAKEMSRLKAESESSMAADIESLKNLTKDLEKQVQATKQELIRKTEALEDETTKSKVSVYPTNHALILILISIMIPFINESKVKLPGSLFLMASLILFLII